VRAVIATLLLCGAAALAACGGDDSAQPAPAQFAVYDWEPNVIGPTGAPEPAAREVTDVPVSRPDAAARAKAARGKTVVFADRNRKGFWVLRDRPALTGRDVARAAQDIDQVTNEPIVVIELTPAGRAKLKRLTQGVVARARARRKRGGGVGPAGFERFAITLDDRLISRPTIDPVELPHGLDGRTGVQLQLDGNLKQAQDVADQLEAAR
jgi:preprotein translocase subunit SecD